MNKIRFFFEANVQLRKTSVVTKEPQENGNKESVFVKPALKPVPPKEATSSKKDHKLPLPKLNSVAERQLRDSPPRKPSLTVPNNEEIDKVRQYINKFVFWPIM